MAPPQFPNGMSLYTLGFATLKYPELPEPIEVPVNNQIGALQRIPNDVQDQMRYQIASQYIDALINYQVSDDPTLADRNSPQHYFSTALCVLNYCSSNPDVCKRIVSHPTLLKSIITQLLEPDFVSRMQSIPRTTHPNSIYPAGKFNDDFGSLLQFLSTMLVWINDVGAVHERVGELVPKLKGWKREFRGNSVKTISRASERLVEQIEGARSMQSMLVGMRSMMEGNLSCGVSSCGVTGAGLTVCNACKIQRYCGRDHQKADWKYHKHICNKGLVEPEA